MFSRYIDKFDYSSRFRILKGGKISLVVSAILGSAIIASAAPTGGVVVSGNTTISQNGNVTNINQTTNKSIINWQNFNVAGNETVNFNMPNSSSTSLNRIIGNEASSIYGVINSNGQVFLVNQNGIYFGKDSQVNTAGFVASTKDIKNEDFLNGKYQFEGDSNASIINLGTITTNNAYTALLAKKVENEGVIKAHLGQVHLVSGDKFTLDINGNSLLKLTIDKGIIDGLVSNKGAVIADGGEIYLTTSALDEVLSGLVNNTGIIQANSVEEKDGKIILFAHGGTGEFGGSIEAKGGFVETSGAIVTLQNNLNINASGGEWLIDPYDYTIDATAAGHIKTALDGGTSVTVETTANTTNYGSNGVNSSNGDITVASNISKTAGGDATLSLKAHGNIIVNDNISISSSAGKLNTILWADSDAIDGGSIYMKNGSSITTNGGHLWMGGGSGTTTWNGLTVGDGYATGTSAGIDLTNTTLGITDANHYGTGNRFHYNGITLLNSNINTSGGDFKASGKSHNAQVTTNKAYIGVFIGGDYQVSTSAGDIVLDGISVVSANDNSWYSGVTLGSANVSGNANSQLITTGGDITINGAVTEDLSAGHPRAISLAVWGNSNKLNIKTTTGNISLTGDNKSTVSNSANRAIGNDIDGWRFTEISSSTGNINITGIGANTGGYDIGFKNAIIKTDGTITFIGDTLNILSSYSTGSQISSVTNGIGSLVIKPYTDSTTIGIGGATGTLELASSYFSTNFLDGFSSITIGDAAAGDITIGGTTTYNDNLTFKTKGNIFTDASASLTANGSNSLVFWADSDANSDGMIYLKNGSSITTNGGGITLSGGSNITTGYAVGNAQNSNGVTLDNVDLLSGGGDILIRGKSGTSATSLTYSIGTYSNINGVRLHGGNTLNSGNGTITIVGESVGTTATANNGIELSHSISDLITSSNTGANAIVLNGTAGSSASSNSFGIYTWLGTIQATNGGNIYLKGSGQKDDGVTIASGSSVLANSGKITIEGTGYGASGKAVNIAGTVGQKSSTSVTSSSSNIEIIGDTFGASGTLQSSGSLIIKPYTASTTIGIGGATGTLALASNYFSTNFVDGFSGITIGSSDQTGAIEIGATAISDALTLYTTGNVTQSGAITGNQNLTLLGTNGIYTLDNTTNNINTLTANTGSVTYVDSDALTLGAITATGAVNVATQTGNMTLNGNITTTDTTSSAIKLNAGKNANAGTSTSGNIIHSNGTVTTGTNGRATLYSGSISGSTGLTALIGSGSGKFRYNSDETSTNYTTALGSGVYAIYREQPTLSVTPSTASSTYGSAVSLTGVTGTLLGYQNGDDATKAGVNGTATFTTIATNSNNVGTYNIAYNNGLNNGIGYAISDATESTNEYSINAKAITVSVDDLEKVINNLVNISVPIKQTSIRSYIQSSIVANSPVRTENSVSSHTKVDISDVLKSMFKELNQSANNFTLVSQLDGQTEFKKVTMDELQQKTPNSEIRVTLGADSFTELINGGMNLPSGISQEFYVITNE